MQRVLVVDAQRKPLMPCYPARARRLLKTGKAVVFRRYPFTILLKERVGGDKQDLEVKLDPGSRVSGIALVGRFQRGRRVVWAAEISHRGYAIVHALRKRHALRRWRRQRKTRYRVPRFSNRRGNVGGLPPSVGSRVEQLLTWVKRLGRLAPLSDIGLELVKFDMQTLQHPEIQGVEYQRGELFGYELRQYLLEKWNHACAYCAAEDVPLEIEHIVPKSRGGTDRVSNLTVACRDCNQCKGNRTAEEFGYSGVQAQAQQPLKDAAAANTMRWVLYGRLKAQGLSVQVGSGGRTKYNRMRQGYSKTHWIDAACVGETGGQVMISPRLRPLSIKALGHGSRQMCRMDKYGFPRTGAKQCKRVRGFQTGDIVKANVPGGKCKGIHVGRLAVRTRGIFRVGAVDGILWRYCRLLHRADGYEYGEGGKADFSTL